MSRVAWKTSHLNGILGTNLRILKWFGIVITPAEKSENVYLNAFQRFCWPLFNLIIYVYVTVHVFPRVIGELNHYSLVQSVSYFNQMLSHSNYWIYNLFVFVERLRMNRNTSSLWDCLENLEQNISLSAGAVLRCHRTCTLLFYAIAPVLLLNILASLLTASSGISWTDVLNMVPFASFYSWASIVLFFNFGHVIAVSLEALAIELKINCATGQQIWHYQRKFGSACRAAEHLVQTFEPLLFATVTFSFISFMNGSYNLMKFYQRQWQESWITVIPFMLQKSYFMLEDLTRLWLICQISDLIHSKALALVPILQNIRNSLYSQRCTTGECEETHAFLLEVSELSPSFTIFSLFNLSRDIILSLIGTTVTYLVVLFQIG